MPEFAILFSTWKVVIKAFGSVLYVLHSSLDGAFLVRGVQMMVCSFKNLHACGYQVPPSVETGCSPHPFTTGDGKRPATKTYFALLICLSQGFLYRLVQQQPKAR